MGFCNLGGGFKSGGSQDGRSARVFRSAADQEAHRPPDSGEYRAWKDDNEVQRLIMAHDRGWRLSVRELKLRR